MNKDQARRIAEEKIDAFLSQYSEEDQELILRYALDHVLPKYKGRSPAIAAALVKLGEQEPVAWRDYVEQRLLNWRQRQMNRSGDRLALDDFMDKTILEDLIDYVCSEYEGPAPSQQTEREITRLTMLADTDKASAEHWRGVAEKQADVLRIAREALEKSVDNFPANSKHVSAISAINQQLGEK